MALKIVKPYHNIACKFNTVLEDLELAALIYTIPLKTMNHKVISVNKVIKGQPVLY